MGATRRRRRWILPVTVLVVLVAAGVAGEFIARAQMSDRVEEAVGSHLPGATGVTTVLPVRPILLDLVRGEVSDVEIRADYLPLDTVLDEDLSVTAVDVHIGRADVSAPVTLHDVTAGGTVPTSDLSSLASAHLSRGDVLSDVHVRGDAGRTSGELAVEARVAGVLPVGLSLRPETGARELRLVPAHITVAGLDLDLDSPRLAEWNIDPGALAIPISLDELPADITLRSAEVEPAGLRVALAAEQIVTGAGAT